jgi:DNA invertase Pin-like site-specific DNA recombinase
MMLIGYARVSTAEQSLDAQLAELTAAGCERVFSEKLSGARASDRQALQKLLKQATHGDVVVVTRLDRLARSTRDLLNIIEEFTREGIGFRSLRETSIDTTSATGRLVLSILGSIGEFERELITARMDEGRKRAVAKGVKFGPKFKLSHYQKQEALARLAAGETQADVARTYGVSAATLCRLQKGAPERTPHPSAGRSGATCSPSQWLPACSCLP